MNIIIINTHYKHRDLNGILFYIGRPKRGALSSPLKNRYSHLDLDHTIKVDSIEDAISCYRRDLEDSLRNKDTLVCNAMNDIYRAALHGTVYLGCWCMDELKPSRRDHHCHAETVRDIILRRYSERGR